MSSITVVKMITKHGIKMRQNRISSRKAFSSFLTSKRTFSDAIVENKPDESFIHFKFKRRNFYITLVVTALLAYSYNKGYKKHKEYKTYTKNKNKIFRIFLEHQIKLLMEKKYINFVENQKSAENVYAYLISENLNDDDINKKMGMLYDLFLSMRKLCSIKQNYYVGAYLHATYIENAWKNRDNEIGTYLVGVNDLITDLITAEKTSEAETLLKSVKSLIPNLGSRSNQFFLVGEKENDFSDLNALISQITGVAMDFNSPKRFYDIFRFKEFDHNFAVENGLDYNLCLLKKASGNVDESLEFATKCHERNKGKLEEQSPEVLSDTELTIIAQSELEFALHHFDKEDYPKTREVLEKVLHHEHKVLRKNPKVVRDCVELLGKTLSHLNEKTLAAVLSDHSKQITLQYCVDVPCGFE